MARRSILFLLLAVLLLVSLGITMLASTSFHTREGGGEAYVTVWKQAVWVGLAGAAGLITAFVPFNLWLRWRWWLLGLAATGLLLCFEWHLAQWLGYSPLIGTRVNGASRWLSLGPGDMRIQPSEFAKIALVIALAGWFAMHDGREKNFREGFLLPGLILAGIVGLIGAEVDLGNGSVAAAVGIGIMFVGGTRLRYIFGLIGAGAAALAAGILLAPNRMARVLAVFDLEKHKDGIGLQQWVSWLAFGSGGLEGRGLGEGRMKLSYLPEAHTDFIFPMIGEEWGLWGSLGTLLLFVVIAVSGMCVAAYAPNRFGKLLGFGLTFMLCLEALLNMGVTTALLPNKGLPMPFVSYGGSSLMAAMVAVGILANLHAHGVHLTRDQLPVIRRGRRWTPQL